MKVEVWASLWSAIGTVAAAGVAAYSARLAWRQVGYQFVPRLIVRSTQFQIRTTGRLKEEFWWEPPGAEARYENGGSEDYRFTMLNVGNGPAFDIRTHTEFDYASVYDDVMRKLSPYIPGLQITYDNFGCQVAVGDEVLGGFRLPGESFGMIEAVGGANTQDRQQSFLIDPNLAFFATCYAEYLCLAHQTEDAARHSQLIPFTLRFEYLDGSAQRQTIRHSMELAVRGGRYKDDRSDGVSMINVYSR